MIFYKFYGISFKYRTYKNTNYRKNVKNVNILHNKPLVLISDTKSSFTSQMLTLPMARITSPRLHSIEN